MSISVALVDDHAIYVHLMQKFFDLHNEFDLVFSATSAAETRTFIEARLTAGASLPDVFLVDYWLQGARDQGGRELGHWILEQAKDARIVIVSANEGENLGPGLDREGFYGYVRKGQSINDLLDAIRHVHNGKKSWGSRSVL